MKGTLTIVDRFGNMVRLVDIDKEKLNNVILSRVDPGSAKSITWQANPEHFEVRWMNPAKRTTKQLVPLEPEHDADEQS